MAITLSHSNRRQVVHTHCLFVKQCKLVLAESGDALKLWRQLWAWQKLRYRSVNYWWVYD